MALPEIRGTGRLLVDPKTGTTKADKPWATALIKFPSWKKTDDGWEEQPDSPVANVSAYDDLAPLLASYAKGDEIGVHGTAKPALWNDKPQFAITATQIWAPEKKSRQAGGKAKPASTGGRLDGARASASASLRQLDARLSAQRAESAA